MLTAPAQLICRMRNYSGLLGTGAAAEDDTKDASTEFTASIDEEAARNSHQQLSQCQAPGLPEWKPHPQLDNQSQDPGPQSELCLLASTKHQCYHLAQCRQHYQDLQEKLLISEMTAFAQANQLEKYTPIFSKYYKLTTPRCLSSP
ncbi:uncharacterized protein isoform X2 [Castor canadensis]|uniref:Uncharacterized protein isoform X2 n=1 Tax=Castor canadensis TaxID=51338 RepID=A0AC58KN02_CASCN